MELIVYFCYAIAVILALVIICIMASKMCDVAELKGYDSKHEHIFALCFFFGLFGYIYVIALPDLKLQRLIKSITDNNKEPIHQEKKVQQEIKAHNPNLEAICKNIPGIEL